MICEACQAEITHAAQGLLHTIAHVVKSLFNHESAMVKRVQNGVDSLFKHEINKNNGMCDPDLVSPSGSADPDPESDSAALEASDPDAPARDPKKQAKAAKAAKRRRGTAVAYPDDFEHLWEQTGKHGNKHPAFVEWDRIKHEVQINTLVDVWRAWEHTDQWRAGFVPHLRKWLHVRGWQDTPPEHEFRGRPATPARGSALNADHAKDWLARRDDE